MWRPPHTGEDAVQMRSMTGPQHRRSRAGWASLRAWSASESLISVDVADHQTKRVGQQHVVGDFIAEAVNDIRGPAFAALLLPIGGRAEDLLKLDLGAVGRLAEVDEIHGVDLDVYVRCARIEQKGLERFLLVYPLKGGRLQLVREEIERLREIPLQGAVIAAIVKLAPAGEVVFAHTVDGDFREVIIVHHLAAPDVRDRDDQRLEVKRSRLSAVEQAEQGKSNKRHNEECDFEIGIRDNRLGIKLDEFVPGLRRSK